MICTCFGKTLDLTTLGRRAGETARLMLGVPAYEAYVAHLAAAHPQQAPMSRDAFFIERQQAKYGGARFRCC
jgi:uncharacterized short protein YbdD (DUF466 family)